MEQNEPSDLEIYSRASALGVVSGLRAMLAPALLSYAGSQKSSGNLKNNFLASPKVSIILGMFAAGELIGDKLPFTPNRTEPQGLGGRIVSGAIVGGTLCAANKKSAWTGAAAGALAAIAAAYAGQHIRQALAEKSGVPSAALGVVEDVIAISIGLKALKGEK